MFLHSLDYISVVESAHEAYGKRLFFILCTIFLFLKQ